MAAMHEIRKRGTRPSGVIFSMGSKTKKGKVTKRVVAHSWGERIRPLQPGCSGEDGSMGRKKGGKVRKKGKVTAQGGPTSSEKRKKARRRKEEEERQVQHCTRKGSITSKERK